MFKQANFMQRTFFIAPIALALLMFGGSSVAAIYKWRDANGRMHYSSKPGPKSKKEIQKNT